MRLCVVPRPADLARTDLKNPSERVDELNGTVRFRELLFQFVLDLYGCLKLARNCAHAVKAGVVTQQLSESSFKGGQGSSTVQRSPTSRSMRLFFLSGS